MICTNLEALNLTRCCSVSLCFHALPAGHFIRLIRTSRSAWGRRLVDYCLGGDPGRRLGCGLRVRGGGRAHLHFRRAGRAGRSRRARVPKLTLHLALALTCCGRRRGRLHRHVRHVLQIFVFVHVHLSSSSNKAKRAKTGKTCDKRGVDNTGYSRTHK